MSEQAVLCFGSIGLLGEYFPTLRKNPPLILEEVDCMRLGTTLEYTGLLGCNRTQLYFFPTYQSFRSVKSVDDVYLLNPDTLYS